MERRFEGRDRLFVYLRFILDEDPLVERVHAVPAGFQNAYSATLGGRYHRPFSPLLWIRSVSNPGAFPGKDFSFWIKVKGEKELG